jgi:hypothetical protein
VVAVTSAGFVLLSVGLRRPRTVIYDREAYFFWALMVWGLFVLLFAWRWRQRFHRADRPTRIVLCLVAWCGVVVGWAAIIRWVR